MRDTVWFVQEKHNVTEGGFALLTLLVSFYLFFLAGYSLLAIVSPIWPLLTLCYWRKHWPTFASVGLFWLVGLCLDIGSAAIIGSYALSYLMAYCVVTVVQRAGALTKQMKKAKRGYAEALFVLIVVFIFQLTDLSIQWGVGELHFSWLYFTPTLFSALLWPWFVLFVRFFHRFFKEGV